jgi:hypothetical protein
MEYSKLSGRKVEMAFKIKQYAIALIGIRVNPYFFLKLNEHGSK